MKICFLSRLDPSDKRGWSGTIHHMYNELQRNYDVTWIGKVEFTFWQELLLKIKRKINSLIGIKRSPENPHFSRFYAENVKERISSQNFDLIFAPAASSLITKVDTNVPIIYLSDATFQKMVGYYPQFSGLTKRQVKIANNIESETYRKASKIIFSSEWARNSAIEDYKVPAEKISVAELGANLLREPTTDELQWEDSEVCNILFMGVMWERKGGDIAYRTYQELKRQNFRCTFTIVGCNPDVDKNDPNITVIPFINKNIEKEYDQLYSILLRTHFLLLPTKAECFGIVFSEASAFGIPSIAYRTGGVPTAICEGRNGILVDLHQNEKKFAEVISQTFSNKHGYKELRKTSRQEFEERLSWKAWGKKFDDVVRSIMR